MTAIEGMVQLAKSAESEPVKLSAQRGILAELRDMSNFAELRAEVEELKQELEKEKKRRASGTGKNPG